MATTYWPSLNPVGFQSISAALLLTVLVCAARLLARIRCAVAAAAPAVLLVWAVALVISWGRFIDAQHRVAEFICLAGIVGFALYCVRRATGALRLWGAVFLIVGILMVAHVATGMLTSGYRYPGRRELIGLMLGGLVVVAITWAFWLSWVFVAPRRDRDMTARWRLERPPIVIACAFWASLAVAGAVNLTKRWSRQAPALRVIAAHGGGYTEFGNAGWPEMLFPPPAEELNPLRRVQVVGKGVSDADLAAFAKVDSLTHLCIWDASEVTDAGLRNLARLKSLEVVEMQGPRVSRQGVEELRTSLPQVKLYGFD